MKVVSNKNNNKLVKGATYEVFSINTLNTSNSRWFRPTITIKELGRFASNNFTNLDGSPIGQMTWKSLDFEASCRNRESTIIKSAKDLKAGDLVVSQISTKLFEKGKIYKVNDVLYKEEDAKSYNGTTYKKVKQGIKIEGYNRFLSIYNFRHLSAEERRNISLGSIFNEEIDIKSVDRSVRKIDNMTQSERDKVLVSSIFQSILDPHRNNMTITEWASKKKGKIYNIEVTDFKPLMNKKLSDIIKMFE